MDKRYLILNADDFGISRQTNEAVIDLYKKSRITSASIMTMFESSEEACKAAKSLDMDVGVHLTFTSDKNNPCRPLTNSKSLTDDDGFFYESEMSFTDLAKNSDVLAEINAQYDFIAEHIKPTHADSHCGTLYGLTGVSFLREVYMFSREKRLPFRLAKSDSFLRIRFPDEIPGKFKALHKIAVDSAEAMGVFLPDNVTSNHQNIAQIPDYETLKAFYIGLIRNLEQGITEIFLHPTNMPETTDNSDWQKGVWEYQLLLDDDFHRAIREEGITLISWGDVCKI